MAVADLDRSLASSRDILGFTPRARWSDGVILEAGSLRLCLSIDTRARAEPHPDDTHVALAVADADFEAPSARIAAIAPL